MLINLDFPLNVGSCLDAELCLWCRNAVEFWPELESYYIPKNFYFRKGSNVFNKNSIGNFFNVIAMLIGIVIVYIDSWVKYCHQVQPILACLNKRLWSLVKNGYDKSSLY